MEEKKKQTLEKSKNKTKEENVLSDEEQTEISGRSTASSGKGQEKPDQRDCGWKADFHGIFL